VECNHLPIKLVPHGYIFFCEFTISFPDTNSLKIPKGQSEAVNRRTDNTMTKRKRRKGQTMIFKTLHRNLKIEPHESH
jgi:hypothetical protein